MKKLIILTLWFLAVTANPLASFAATDTDTENAIILLHYPPNMTPALQAKAINATRRYCTTLGFSDIDDCYRTLRTETFQQMAKPGSEGCCCNGECDSPFYPNYSIPGTCNYCAAIKDGE